MDIAAAKKLRSALSVHFVVLASLTAMLVATGSQSYFLPIFISTVAAVAYILVDRLEWFELGRIGSFIGMLTATAFSIGSYLYSAFSVPSESGQLLAIAGLLVYPEAVLFMQGKSLRVFEQLAVFLLLEMIVAALVNDNILFGLLLAPIMLLWVSALFLFSRYATLVQIDPSIDKPNPILAEILYQRFVKTVIRPAPKQSAVSAHATLGTVQSARGFRRALQSVPIGIGSIVFAAFFFYLMPRTSIRSLDPSLAFEPVVGLPKSLDIGTVGRLLANPTPVMRVSLRKFGSGENYSLKRNEPPYLRARVMETYQADSNGRGWVAHNEWIFGGISEYRRLRGLESLRNASNAYRDLVTIEFDIKRKFVSVMYCAPPAFAIAPSQEMRLNYDSYNLVLEDFDLAKLPRGRSLVYDIGTLGFKDGVQLRVTPAQVALPSFTSSRGRRNINHDLREFENANRYREELLEQSQVDLNDRFGIADFFERHFTNGEFTYTLDLRPPIDPDLDPIEDFLINQKKGHCQYYASAMVMLLRQSNIHSRIVVGYRPTEFNSRGKWFSVRQNDAHAWVEAKFTHEELSNTFLKDELTDAEEYWVRFDPTPSGTEEGELAIVEQSGQTLDYVEKLWKDYVVEGQKLSGDNTLYAPVAENSKDAYEQVLEKLRNFRQNLESGHLFSGQGGIGFEWPLAILIIGIGCLAILVWRLAWWLPRLAPRLAKRFGLERNANMIQQAFFARCIELLKRQGLTRGSCETPQEFTQRAVDELTRKATRNASLRDSLSLLTTIYYRLRFSQHSQLSKSETQAIDEAIRELTLAKSK